MSAHPAYPVPLKAARAEITVINSRFIASLEPAFSVEAARVFIARVRAEFSDAAHHVPAYLIGHGAFVTSHCSDDGEPAGTAGRPALAVLAGSGLGDAAVVVTRYFGGTKLGTGGLVRAYGDAVRAVLSVAPRGIRMPVHTLLFALPYPLFERARLLVSAHGGKTLGEDFGVDVKVTARFPVQQTPAFQAALVELSHGAVQAEIIETGEQIVPLP